MHIGVGGLVVDGGRQLAFAGRKSFREGCLGLERRGATVRRRRRLCLTRCGRSRRRSCPYHFGRLQQGWGVNAFYLVKHGLVAGARGSSSVRVTGLFAGLAAAGEDGAEGGGCDLRGVQRCCDDAFELAASGSGGAAVLDGEWVANWGGDSVGDFLVAGAAECGWWRCGGAGVALSKRGGERIGNGRGR